MSAQSSLNGYFERVRRLLRLVGVSDVPEGIVPVVIVGDSREAAAANSSYRHFGAAHMEVLGPTGAGNFVKYRFLSDVVITEISHWQGAVAATSMGEIRVASKAVVDADNTAVYTDVAADRGGWMQSPEAGNPPVQMALNTGVLIGRLVKRIPRIAGGNLSFPAHATTGHLFMPEGSALCIVAPTASTNWVTSIVGYSARN